MDQLNLFDIVSEAIKPEAETLRDEGMKRSADKADATNNNWSIIAYNKLQEYLKEFNQPFLAEDFRVWSIENGLEEPPSNRAFGSIMTKARKNKLIKHIGYARTSNPKAHKTPASQWMKI